MSSISEQSLDRLYELLPVVYRRRDAEQGYPLRALLQVIAEQVNVVETDIDQLYQNLFIETCEDWVVPYLGDLVGYRIVHEAGEPGELTTPRERLRNKILIPRREVANTIHYRRRKGTLALLEILANQVSDWPARAVEFYRLLGWTQALNHLRPERGRTVDLYDGDALERLDGPFDELAHSVDVRRINSRLSQGWTNIPSVGLFVWRLRAYSVSQTPAYYLQETGTNCYTFSVLGNDAPLYTRPEREASPTDIAGEMNLPTPIRRRAFEAHKQDYYGVDKSLQIWQGIRQDGHVVRQLVPPESIIVADLTDWTYRPKQRGQVAVDPVLGRIAFPPRDLPKQGLWVSYHYGFSADMGGGEYNRPLSQPAGAMVYRVGEREELRTINEALGRWHQDWEQADEQQREKLQHAVIEITDSGAYVEQINIELKEKQSLQLRAANLHRPILRLLDWHTDRPDSLWVRGAPGGRFTLDGLLIAGRGVQVVDPLDKVTIRHCTLVPGWSLYPDCEPRRPTEASLELIRTRARVTIQHSIVGSIQVTEDEVGADPIPIQMSDCILDATSPDEEAIGAPEWPLAHAVLTLQRCTVIGQIEVHAIDLAENSIFDGRVMVGRRQRGCMRFCYVRPDSRTPRRYSCQPDLVKRVIREEMIEDEEEAKKRKLTQAELDALEPEIRLAAIRESERVRPQFNSARYGTPAYCQLAAACAVEIKRGADDESEMGAFHDLYQPQRAANLRVRLEEYTPAGMDVGIIYAS